MSDRTDDVTPSTAWLLPAIVDGTLTEDPQAFRDRQAALGSRRAMLDWSEVVEADDDTLRLLLAGLTLERDEDILGIATVPDALAERVAAILDENAVSQPRARRSRREARPGPVSAVGQRPAVWTAGDEPTDVGESADDGDDLDHEDEPEPAGSADDPVRPGLRDRLPTPVEIRDELEQLVLKDLLGPAGGPDEIVTEDTVRDRYLVGMLAPKRAAQERDVDPRDGAGDDDFAVADGSTEEGGTEREASGPDWLFPSSFGLSFVVDGSASAVRVTARWGRYERVHSVGEEPREPEAAPAEAEAGTLEPLAPIASELSGAGAAQFSERPRLVWQRTQVEATIPSLRLVDGPIAPHEVEPGVVVQGLARRRDGDWLVSLFLVNEQQIPARTRTAQDTFWLFQPELVVEGVDGTAVFVRRPSRRDAVDLDPLTEHEEQTMAMLYRRHQEFAVGHGVSVHVEAVPGQPNRAERLSTRVVPIHEVPRTEPPTPGEIQGLDALVLDMKVLAELENSELAPSLRPLVDAYGAWIEQQQVRLDAGRDGVAEYATTAAKTLDDCRRAHRRIAEGVALLGTDEQAAEAFRFMNRSMWLQRTRGLFAEAVRRVSAAGRATAGPEADPGTASDAASGAPASVTPTPEAFDIPSNRTWYPFQLAFILQSLPGLTDLGHPDRVDGPDATADLLWFPTGGGKTEAYLGLSAYTLAIRRLQGDIAGHSGEAGVAVIMRYTLRLLTLQQFQRATALVCACEVIRRESIDRGDDRWGREPFRIGLWVGQRMTPNTTEAAHQAALQLKGTAPGSAHVAGGSPAQLTACPWCGTKLVAGKDLEVHRYGEGEGRTYTFCGDTLGSCPFSRRQAPKEGLPVIVVDEEIYRRLPSILISTVDKFAQLPWEGETQMLFGRVDGRCERHGYRSSEIDDADSHPARRQRGLPPARTVRCLPLRPPDLIVQDELHLISGPLGTLVGLYETAIDELSCWEVNGRRVRPKVVASTATVRRARDQVQALFVRRLEVFPPNGLDVEDNFFSRQRPPSPEKPGRRYVGICAPGRRLKVVLIRVYLAYLGAAQLLYDRYGQQADPWMTLVGYFNSLRELGGMKRLVDDDIDSRLRRADERGLAKRRMRKVEELTSRMGSTQIPTVLDSLETRFDPVAEEARRIRRGKGSRSAIPLPVDVLLATNMVSVGVDVRRLGLMVVAGQPKTTAEYIQATSRVGRASPGLVCTVMNWARPRDLSHYESFEHYHATFYQQVEALSVTPFAPRAIDRGLSALFVSLVRLVAAELNPNEAARSFTRSTPLFDAAKRAIVERAHQVSSRADVRDEVEARLDVLADAWAINAADRTGGRELHYQGRRGGIAVPLLETPGVERWQRFTCLRSLRDVEPASALVALAVDADFGLDDDPPRRGTGLPPASDEAESVAEGAAGGASRRGSTHGSASASCDRVSSFTHSGSARSSTSRTFRRWCSASMTGRRSRGKRSRKSDCYRPCERRSALRSRRCVRLRRPLILVSEPVMAWRRSACRWRRSRAGCSARSAGCSHPSVLACSGFEAISTGRIWSSSSTRGAAERCDRPKRCLLALCWPARTAT